MIKYELRPATKRRGPVKLVEHVMLSESTGFRSIYGFDATTAAIIIAANSTAGLDALPVYGHEVLIDFDDQYTAASELATWLKEHNINFHRFFSGGRSIHFHIKTELLTGVALPYRHKCWVKEVAPKADMTIYMKTGMFRLEGTYHVKYPGQRKKLLETFDGDLLTVPEPAQPFVRLSTESSRGSEEAAMWANKMEMRAVSEGTTGRNLHAFTMIKRMFEAGFSAKDAAGKVLEWNRNLCSPPLREIELIGLIRKVYR